MASFLSTLFGGGAEKEAADATRKQLAVYGPEAQGYLTQGYNTGVTNLNKAVAGFEPLAALGAKYNQGGDLYRDSLGINGPEGNTRATAAFQNNPGYTGAVDAGLDAIKRMRGYGSMSDSGNANIDALRFGQNLQNQQYDSWRANLERTGQTGVGLIGAAATGQGAGYGSLANLAQQYGQNQSGVAGNVLSGNVNANNLEAAGQAAGAKNLLGAGLSLATLAMGGAGGGGFGGSLIGSLFKPSSTA